MAAEARNGKILRFAIWSNFAVLGNRKFSFSLISDFALDNEQTLQCVSVGPLRRIYLDHFNPGDEVGYYYFNL